MQTKNGTWLDELHRQLSEISDEEANSIMPKTKLCRHDHVVGVVTPDLQKLLFLCYKNKRLSKEASAAAVNLPPQARTEMEVKIWRHDKESETIYEMFWTSCVYAFPALIGKEYMGIKEGWQIAWSEHPRDSSLRSIQEQFPGMAIVLGEILSNMFPPPRPNNEEKRH